MLEDQHNTGHLHKGDVYSKIPANSSEPVKIQSEKLPITALTYEEAFDVLANASAEDCETNPIPNPKNGQQCIFSYCDEARRSDWVSDHLKWVNNGRKYREINGLKLVKRYHKRIYEGKKSDFHRYSFEAVNENGENVFKKTVVQYIGLDDQVSIEPHGNRLKHLYRPTCEQCLLCLKKLKQPLKKPSIIYKESVGQSGIPTVNVATAMAKDLKQVQNKQYSERLKKQIGRDTVQSLQELFVELGPEVIPCAELIPALSVVVVNRQLIDEWNLVQRQAGVHLLSYDTAFNLGDCYVSIFVAKHCAFQNEPAFPLAIFIHQRRRTRDHEYFLKEIKSICPSIDNRNVALVTDREPAILNACSNVLKRVNRELCWNHLISDVKTWLLKKKATAADLQVYVRHVMSLLKTDTQQQYVESYEKISLKWSLPFKTYFDSNLAKDVMTNNKGSLEKLGLYTENSGLTTNVSESMNTVMKRVVKWESRTIDHLVLVFHFLFNYYVREFIRGRCGLGNHNLKPALQHLRQEVTKAKFPEDVVTPEEIIEKTTFKMTQRNSVREEETKTANLTALGIANYLVHNRKINFEQTSECFVVSGLGSNFNCVRLFPKPECTCQKHAKRPSECHHILAVKLSMHDETVVNVPASKKVLSDLSSSSRKRRKVGIKGPCLNVEAASDSLEKQNAGKILLTEKTAKLNSKKTTSEREPGCCSQVLPTLSSSETKEIEHESTDEAMSPTDRSMVEDCNTMTDLLLPTASKVDIEIDGTSRSMLQVTLEQCMLLQGNTIGSVHLDSDDFASLAPGEYLTDNIIDGFIESLLVRSNSLPSNMSVADIKLYESLRLNGVNNSSFNFGTSERLLKRDVILVPCNTSEHWILLLICPNLQLLVCLDSCHGLNKPVFESFMDYLNCLSQNKINWDEWSFHSPIDHPRQKNGFDCGVHVCMYANAVVSGVPCNEFDSNAGRTFIAKECANKLPERPKPSKRNRQNFICNFDKPKMKQIKRVTPRGYEDTTQFLTEVCHKKYKATFKVCFLKEQCKRPRDHQMILCIMCDDWLHLECVGLQGKQLPEKDYICNRH